MVLKIKSERRENISRGIEKAANHKCVRVFQPFLNVEDEMWHHDDAFPSTSLHLS